MTVYSGIPASVYSNPPKPGDVFIVTSATSLENPAGLNMVGTTEYLVSTLGSKPSIGSTGVIYGNVVVHALGPNPDGSYETTNATLSSDKGGSGISGALIIGTKEDAHGQLARGNLTATYGRPDSYFSLGSAIYVEPQSTLSITPDRGNSPHQIGMGNTVVNGGSIDAAVNVGGNGNFDLESYLSDPFQQSSAVVTFQGGATVQSAHVGYGSQLNLGEPLAFHGAITEDPVSQVVLRGTTTTGFNYQNGMLNVMNGGVQVADLKIAPASGANGFSLTQIGSDTVISSVGMNAQQLAQEFVGIPVLHYVS